ncbi:gliding motility protein GldB [Apibacter muscae]|uniref:Gliding motility protein GldB n=1 Tax=Apibacter muscae TaxID=2509004 RepID=A0A563DG33_9FLAO|nr:gliding motility protein GldB [Apibacter muscae]TWP23696.1 gliding motility protein GldB [Apibacter muscae]TWP28981.1 gliding motility protein GldB [Apibacter muscae]TWP30444.1 gliding motility protein GldB [Apibacter muscae]
MVKITKFLYFFLILALISNCSKKNKAEEYSKRWKIDVGGSESEVEIIDISKDFYNLNSPISNFKEKYPFFLDARISDQKYETQRRDTTELNIYKEIVKNVNTSQIQKDLTDLFSHIKYYYPEFKIPKVYLYSSFLQDYLNPVTYVPEQNAIFIATDNFLGADNKYYNLFRIDKYLQKTMSPNYLSSKVTDEIIKQLNLLPKKLNSQNFVSQMIRQGKILALKDAFLPDLPDEYKMEYTKEQYDWAKNNEFDIWNFFVQENYLFSDDIGLSDRFLSLAPFSKFYTEVDTHSPGNIGSWVGWQIVKKYLQENPEIKLQDFINNTNHDQIFSKSRYKPKQNETVESEK